MRSALSCSALLLFSASVCDGVRHTVPWRSSNGGSNYGQSTYDQPTYGQSTYGQSNHGQSNYGQSSYPPVHGTSDHSSTFDNFINRASQARSLVQGASNTHQRWVAVRELTGETSEAAGEGQVAMQELGGTFQYINQEITDNELEPLLDTEMTAGDLRALRNGNALIRVAREFVGTSEQLLTISNLLEVIVETMVAVLDLTESVPGLAGAWGGFDSQHVRQLTGRVSAVSARFNQEAQNLHTVDEQLSPLDGWDDMGGWGRARVVATNFIQLRSGMRGLRNSKNSLEEFYHGEAMSTMTDVFSTVQTMNSVANRFNVR